MAKQFNFNTDMEKYLDKRKDSDIGPDKKNSKKANKLKFKNEPSVSDLYPELESDNVQVHVIKKEKKLNNFIKEYKKKIVEMLRKEEKEIEEIEVEEDNPEIQEEIIEEIEEIEEQEAEERKTFSEKFKNFLDSAFGKKETQEEIDIDEELIEEDIKRSHEQRETQEEIEEEIEEEILDEELAKNNRFSTWLNNVMIKMGLKETDNEDSEYIDDEDELYEDDRKITKLILYKAQMDKDVKLALLIAQKYMKHLKFEAHKKFEESGDKENFEETLNKLKIN